MCRCFVYHVYWCCCDPLRCGALWRACSASILPGSYYSIDARSRHALTRRRPYAFDIHDECSNQTTRHVLCTRDRHHHPYHNACRMVQRNAENANVTTQTKTMLIGRSGVLLKHRRSSHCRRSCKSDSLCSSGISGATFLCCIVLMCCAYSCEFVL